MTNLLSCFHVLEGYTLTASNQPLPPPTETASSRVKIVGVGVWRRSEDDDPDREMEFQLTMAFPGGQELILREGLFRMAKTFHRFIARFEMEGLPFSESGNMIFYSKIRPVGSSDWQVQQYVIPVTVNVLDGSLSQAD